MLLCVPGLKLDRVVMDARGTSMRLRFGAVHRGQARIAFRRGLAPGFALVLAYLFVMLLFDYDLSTVQVYLCACLLAVPLIVTANGAAGWVIVIVLPERNVQP